MVFRAALLALLFVEGLGACRPRNDAFLPQNVSASDAGEGGDHATDARTHAARRPDVLEMASRLAAPRVELQRRLGLRQCDGVRRPVPCWGDTDGITLVPPERHGAPPRIVSGEPHDERWELRAGGRAWRLGVEGMARGAERWTERAGERWVVADALRATDLVVVVEDRRVTCSFVLRDASAPHRFIVDVTALDGSSDADASAAVDLKAGATIPLLDANEEARAATLEWKDGHAQLELDPTAMTYPLLATIELDLVVPRPAITRAPVEWRNAAPSAPGTRDGHVMAYDAARKRTVLFGGGADAGDDRVWQYDGTSWEGTQPSASPWHRRDLSATYDAARKQTLFFGGADREAHPARDTWLWDGAALTRALPKVSPPARFWSAMAYDAARARVVLVGGTGRHGQPDACQLDCEGTWEWDGSSWDVKTPAVAPSPRWGSALAYDAARRRMVLFGGGSYGPGCGLSGCNDTWEWDGATWSRRTPHASPPPRTFAAAAFDAARKRVVLFGGRSEQCPAAQCGDTWEWDGVTWARRTPARSPAPRARPAMVYDDARGRVVLYGGGSGEAGRDAWEWDGATWTPRWQPPDKDGAVLAFDPVGKRVVMFGGERPGDARAGETWRWDGATWQPHAGGPAPSARRYHAMATDLARGRIVLFGGESNGCAATPGTASACGDTWFWNGTEWSIAPSTPGASPSPRYGHAMAYDEARKRVVLSGGASTNGSVDTETWEHDGQAWSRRNVSGPSSVWGKMAYDAERKRTVLVLPSTETWEWDGSVWSKLGAATPSLPMQAAAGYDRNLRRVVLFGGRSSYDASDALWAWDGAAWSRVDLLVTPGPRTSHAMTWDDTRSEMVVYGGLSEGVHGGAFSTETWVLSPTTARGPR